ncbi:MAG: DUF1800 domain-containing protein [Actinomycetes bacterium]
MTPPTRRQLLQAAGTLGLASGVGAALPGGTAAAATAPRPGSYFVPADQHLHLLRRATFGPTTATYDHVKSIGSDAWLDEQLNPASIDDSDCQQMVRRKFEWMSWSIAEVMRQISPGARWPFMTELSMSTIARATWSKRQLFEVMVEFWNNHLYIQSPTNNVWFARHHYDSAVIRAHALGRFEDMLIASAQHPAMLGYLNNAESTGDNPNENYGRELLELHSVGLDADYSEQEMYDSALIMTGFTLDPDTMLYIYDSYRHFTGPVKVLDFQDDNPTRAGGEDLAIRYLKHLASHPSTARHICRKLWFRFISDEPDENFVDELAAVYLSNDTAIEPVLRHLFASAAFHDSVGQKLRRPFEDVIATLRLLRYRPEAGSGTDGLRSLHWMMSEIGHAPFAWPLVDGYPDDAISWLSAGSTLNRWNRHYSLAAHWAADDLPQPPLRSLLPDHLPKTWGAMLDALSRQLVFRTLEDRHKKVILRFLDVTASDAFDRRDADARHKMAPAVALILDSPYHEVR